MTTGSYLAIITLNVNGLNAPVQFSSVQSLSCIRLFATPRIAARQASLSITNSRSSLRLTPQPKDKDWLNGYKNKTLIYAVYKRPTSKIRDTYRLKLKGWKKIFHTNGDQKKAGVVILI